MNKTFLVATAVILAAVAVLLIFDFGQDAERTDAPTEATVAPEIDTTALPVDFSLPDLDGVVRQLSDWSGRPRLVNFWATWCAPCRREIPLLKSVQENQHRHGLQVIGIAVDFHEEVVAYAEEADFNYPILVGQEDAMAAAESSGVDFIGLPFTLVLSREGVLLNAHFGEIVEEHIDTIVAVLGQLDNGELDIAGARAALHDL